MRVFIAILTVAFAFVFLAGCGKEQPAGTPLKTAAKKAPAQAVEKKEALPEETPGFGEGYVYEAKGRRDPFLPLVETKKKTAGEVRRVGTLESYDAADFQLVAVAKKVNQRYGLLLAPDNKAYTVREGTVLGLHNGKVEKIENDKIIIIEHIKDYKGELKPKKVVLELRKGEGE